MMRRRINEATGRQALHEVLADGEASVDPHPQKIATAVRYLLEELGTNHPGRTVEVRVPPYGAVQCVEGPTHTRGTPPNVIECDPVTWIELATGKLSWKDALATHRVIASGVRANLDGLVPLV